jgi:hypothetical protein
MLIHLGSNIRCDHNDDARELQLQARGGYQSDDYFLA